VSSAAWISSAAASPIGTILTEGSVRRAREAGVIGLLGLWPAWGIALLGTRSRLRSVDWNRRGSCGHDRPFELLVAVIATA